MSREIKFRAWVKELKKLSAVNEFYFTGGTYVCDYEYALDPEDIELMQYTGLKDRNGVEIYEGDIVNHSKQGNLIVKYGNKHFDYAGFTLINSSGMTNTLQNPYIYEVIGNIYEDPELLKPCNS